MSELFDRVVSREVEEYQLTLDENHSELLSSAKDAGSIQGSQNLPPRDQELPSPYEGEIRAKYQEVLSDLKLRFGETLQTLYVKIIGVEKSLNRPISDWDDETEDLVETLEERSEKKEQQEKEVHEKRLSAIDDFLDDQITAPYNQVLEARDAVRKRLGRNGLDVWLASPFWYFTFLALIGLSEFPLNSLVFAVVGGDRLETLMMAGTLVIGIPLAAHFAGIALKRRNENKINIWIALTASLAVIGLSYFVGEQRELYIRLMGLTDVNAETSKIVLIVLSILLYGIAMLLSYGYHDQSSELEEVEKRYRDAKSIYDAVKPPKERERQELLARHDEKMAAIKNEHLISLQKVADRKQRAQQSLTNMRGSYDAELNALQALEDKVSAACERTIHTYRTSNTNARRNHQTPKCFLRDPRPISKYFANLVELDPNPTI